MDKNIPLPVQTRASRMRQTQINTNYAMISSISSNNDNKCNGLSDFEFTGYVNGKIYNNKFLFKDVINKVVPFQQPPFQSIKHCICNNKPPQLIQLKITTDSSKYGKFENTLSLNSYSIGGTLNFGPNFDPYKISGTLTNQEEQQQLLQQLCLN